MDSYFSYKCLNAGYVLQMLTDGLWVIVMFLSVIWTLILTAPIHC